MPYFIALVPIMAFVGIVGTMVSLARRRTRSALAFGIVAVGSTIYAIFEYYASV